MNIGMNRKLFFMLLALVMMSTTAFAQASLEELDGEYESIGLDMKSMTRISIQRTRVDTVRIIICDTSLFRNDLIKGALYIYPNHGEWYCQADNFKGRVRYWKETEELVITFYNDRGKEEILGRWRRINKRRAATR